MNRTYKLIASRGNEIIFDGRIDAESPRDARRRMKELLGLQSLSGIVYTVTELPVDLIRQLVDARIAEVMGGAEVQLPASADIASAVAAQLEPILRRLEALDIESLVNNAAGLMADLRRQVNDGEVAIALREASETLTELRAEIRKARFEDTAAELRDAMHHLSEAGRSTQELMSSREVRDALVRIPAAVTALEQTLRTARGTTADLQADLSPLMRDLRSSVANLRDTTEALRRNPSQTLLGAPPPPPNRERR